jgi:hypothetical protein
MAIVNVTFDNTSTVAQTNVPVAFAQIFAQGHLPAGSFVRLVGPGNSIVPCQMDAKATYKDGSIKHALLAAILPSLPASESVTIIPDPSGKGSVTYGIEIAQAGPSGTAALPVDFPGLNAIATITDNGTDIAGPNAGTIYTANAADRLAFANYKTHRSGPICSEWIVRVPFLTAEGVRHPDLHARFEIQVFKGQQRARVHCIVENSWIKPKATPSGSTPWEPVSLLPVIYAPKLTIGSTVVYQRNFSGYHRARLNVTNSFNGAPTGLQNNATAYTATITIDGIAKPISLVGSANQYYGNLYANITAQLGGLGACVIDDGNLGLRIKSATTGAGSSAVISDYGTLFPALGHFNPYRPMRGDEHTHHPAQRWKKTYWWGAEPSVHIVPDMAYLIASYALPNYDLSIVGSQGAIDARWDEISANSDLGRNGIQKAEMPGQGGAPGIGILPEWQAMFVIKPVKKAKDIMLLQADLMGSWSVCRREYDTDEPVSMAKWPYASYVRTIADSRNYATGLNEGFLFATNYPAGIPSSGMSADLAHHPDFNFVPYMVTGDNFYLEGLLFYYTFISQCLNPHYTYRDGAKCLWRAEPQARGKAWTMRTAVHAGYLVPDNHTQKAEIEYAISQNIPSLISIYATPGAKDYNMFGLVGDMPYDYPGAANVAANNFMEEFVCQATGRAIELGYTGFLPFLKYKALHVAGRLTSGPDFCWQLAYEYQLRYKDIETSPLYTSWAEVYQKTAKPAVLAAQCGSPEMAAALGTIQNGFTGYPTETQGYPANGQPAIAYCATYNMPKCDDGWLVFINAATKPQYEYGPQFAILPRDIPDEPIRVQLYRSGPSGLGGAISTVVSGAAFFDDIQPAESIQGGREYRCDYVKNEHPTKTLYDAVLWLSANTPSPSTIIKAGLGTSGLNGTAQTIANETTAPVGVTFSEVNTAVDGVKLGDLPPLSTRTVWYERTTSAGAAGTNTDSFIRTIEGKIE